MTTILIIEDNLAILENTTELLELEGYRVIAASTGEEGVMRACQNIPDLIMSDVKMPGIDGYEVLKQLTQNPSTTTIPFIFLSAKSGKRDVKYGKNLGADDFLIKPVRIEELLKSIKGSLEKKRMLDEKFSDNLEELNHLITQNRYSILDKLAE